ncbi:MAG: hypothetical protein WC538_23565 [Thermoanaerobaculia bacterium]|jgi:hypothetical protein
MDSANATTRLGRPLALALFLLLTVVSITPIRSYDFFWHLATGRWIADHHALPASDPFSLSSDRVAWVDGEWLFQLGAWGVAAAGGEAAIPIARAIVVAAIVLAGVLFAAREAGTGGALFLAAIGLMGASHRLTARPETVATLLLVLALAVMLRPITRSSAIALLAIVVVWINVHPSALLAPALAAIAGAGCFVDGTERARTECLKRMGLAAAGGIALLANPWGLEGVLAPLRLAKLAGSGLFVNMEWSATRLADFPLIFVVAPAGLVLLVSADDRRALLPRTLVFVALAFLAFRYVRNHGFFFAALPLLVAPAMPRKLPGRVTAIAAAAILAIVVARQGWIGVGADRAQFPVASVARLQQLELKGNVYNPDQLGGYLIWRFYPERRVVTDGRNELHLGWIREYGKARLDSRAWNALVAKYKLTLAVEEYRRESMDVVDAVTGERKRVPASLVYFPRETWALVAFDDVGLVFARRDAHDAALIAREEYRTLVPDGAMPLVDEKPETIELARREIARARAELGRSEVVERIARGLGGGSTEY